MNLDKINAVLGVIRHSIGYVGGGLVGFQLATSSDITSALASFDGAVGGIMGLIAVGASIYAKANETIDKFGSPVIKQ